MDHNIDELLKACGESSKAMRAVAQELRDIGLDAYADLLERAHMNLSGCVMIHYEDTQPINIST